MRDCEFSYWNIANIFSAVIREPFTQSDVYSGPLFERLQENVPVAAMSAPVFLAQGSEDALITPGAQISYVVALCDNGHVVEYHTYEDRGHLSLVADDSPMLTDLVTWTQARFDGEPVVEYCTISQPDH